MALQGGHGMSRDLARMNRSLFCALSLLFLLGGFLPIAPEREPSPAAVVRSLPAGAEIKELAQLKLLKDLTPRLQHFSLAERREVYLAIAVERNLLTSTEALELLQSLGAVKGFDAAARQLCGYGSPARDGALYELRVGRAFVEKGMPVIEIRQPFKGDPNKRLTDIDLVVEHPVGHLTGIECKSGTPPAVNVNADAETLQHFIAKHPGARAAFSFGGKPVSQKLLESKGIAILTGSPMAQADTLWETMPAAEKLKETR